MLCYVLSGAFLFFLSFLVVVLEFELRASRLLLFFMKHKTNILRIESDREIVTVRGEKNHQSRRPPAGPSMSQTWREMLTQMEAKLRPSCGIFESYCCSVLVMTYFHSAVPQQDSSFSTQSQCSGTLGFLLLFLNIFNNKMGRKYWTT
jgi:hypothetical protein